MDAVGPAPLKKPSAGRKLAMRSYSLSLQPATPASPPSRWTPATLELAAAPSGRGETLPKAKSATAAISSPTAAMSSSVVTNKDSPFRKRPSKASKRSKKTTTAVVSSSPRRPAEPTSRREIAELSDPLPVSAVAAASTAEMEIERFEREFLKPLLESSQQQLVRLKSSCGDLQAATAADVTQIVEAADVAHHRDLR